MTFKAIMKPAQFHALLAEDNPVQQVLNRINAAMAEPASVPTGTHPYSLPFYYVEATVELTVEDAQELLRVCREAGWLHVQIAYTPKAIEIRFSNDARHSFFPSYYRDERGRSRQLTAPG